MRQDRLHALADGIFAIVMTLLVLDLKVPNSISHTNYAMLTILSYQWPVFVSYFISFALLFVYWRAHNFIISNIAKNIDIQLLNLNAIFLFLVGLIPFSTHLLGQYSDIQTALIFYALNVMAIGSVLIAMRLYVERTPTIETAPTSQEQLAGALIRTGTPIVFAGLAIPLSFVNTQISYVLLLLAVAYNFHPNAANITRRVLGRRLTQRWFKV